MLPEKNFNGIDPDNLRMENELKKIKLMFEHGADFYYPKDQPDLPPEIEYEFLKDIEEFENALHNNQKIKLFDYIGKPEFRNSDAIPDLKISIALQTISELLNENQIDLVTLYEVEERVLYRFITEELFLHEIDNIRIPGLRCCFIYEEFHPNREQDIKEQCADFITAYLNKDLDDYSIYRNVNKSKEEILRNFRDAYDSFNLDLFNIKKVCFDHEAAKVYFTIDFTGRLEGTSETQEFCGEGEIALQYFKEYWQITGLIFPASV